MVARPGRPPLVETDYIDLTDLSCGRENLCLICEGGTITSLSLDAWRSLQGWCWLGSSGTPPYHRELVFMSRYRSCPC